MISKIGYSPNFTSNIVVDIGGSTKEGSCKIDVSTNDTKQQIYKEKTRVNKYGEEKFVDANDFLNRISKRVAIAQKAANAEIDAKGLDPKEKQINKLSILVPSYVYDNQALFLANLKDANNKPLRDINFNNLPSLLAERGVQISPNLKVNCFQDAIGSGLAMAKRLKELGMLEPGKYYTVAITGGGCGVSNIRALNDDKILVDSSGSSYFTDNSGVQKVSTAGASAPSVIKNFCKALGLDEEITSDIASCGIGEFVTNKEFHVPSTPQGAKLEKLLIETEKYEKIGEDDDDRDILAPKTEFNEKFKHARYNAINKYAHALARFAVIKENEGSNGLIVTGPLARALDKSCREDYKTTLSDWITDKIDESYNTFELGKAKGRYDFQVYCGKEFEADDNTAGNELLNKAKMVGNSRFNWLEVDMGKLD